MVSVCWWYFFLKIIELLDMVCNMNLMWLSCFNYFFLEFFGKWKYIFCMFILFSIFVYLVNVCLNFVEV